MPSFDEGSTERENHPAGMGNRPELAHGRDGRYRRERWRAQTVASALAAIEPYIDIRERDDRNERSNQDLFHSLGPREGSKAQSSCSRFEEGGTVPIPGHDGFGRDPAGMRYPQRRS